MRPYNEGDEDTRNWGKYRVTEVEYNDATCIKCEKDITVNPGFMLSIQSHDRRSEVWEVKDGSLTVILDGNIITLNSGEKIDIPTGSVHTMANLAGEACVVHEVQSGDCAENDIHRYWDSNGRKVEESHAENVIATISKCEGLLPELTVIQKKTEEKPGSFRMPVTNYQKI